MSSGFSRHLISGLRARVPVPEHGASTRMRSNFAVKGSGFVASSVTTGIPSGNSIRARLRCRSQAMALMSFPVPARSYCQARAQIEEGLAGLRIQSGTTACEPMS